jgi:phage shock protein C
VQGGRSDGERQALPRLVAMDPARPLRRSRQRLVAGVCGGLADWLGWDRTLVRVLYVLVSILSAAFPGLLVYAVLWIVMPNE